MTTHISLVVLSLLALSCNNAPSSIDSSQPAALAGNWLWTGAIGGLTGNQVIRPLNKTVVSFTGGGMFSVYQNDTLLRTSMYSVKKGKTIYSADSMNIILFQDTTIERRVIFKLTADSLELADNFYDGFGYTYIRTSR